ncbi:MAG: hypothetical protein K8T26_02760 [Lentisphaerae bacterium]|nr:hypothetical protein [Lentisphaerota bacterium]
MKVRNALCFGAAVVLAWGVAASQASTGLPYAQTFETWTPDAHWAAAGGGTISAAAGAKLPGSSGVNGLSLDNDTVTLSVTPATYNNVWIQIYAKPVVGTADPASVSGQTGAFYLRDNGELRACIDAALNTWVTVATGVPQGAYLGFIVHADYSTSQWEIFYSTSPSQVGTMQKATAYNAGLLPFATAGAQIQNVSVQSGDPAYVDLVAVSRGFTAAAAGAGNVATYEHATTAPALALQDFTLPVYSAAYVGNNALGDDLGNSILSGLVHGDSIQVWDPGQGVFVTYAASGALPVFDNLGSPGAVSKNSMFIYSNTRLLLDPNNARSQTFGFYPYDSTTVLAYAGVSTPAADGDTESVTLNGTDVNGTGFTALNWVDADTFANIEIEDPAGALVEGDRMFVAPPASPNSFTEYWWDDANNWRDFNNAVVSTRPISAGSKIWVKRQTNTDASITVTH